MRQIFQIAAGILLACALIFVGAACWEASAQFRSDLHYVRSFSKGGF